MIIYSCPPYENINAPLSNDINDFWEWFIKNNSRHVYVELQRLPYIKID